MAESKWCCDGGLMAFGNKRGTRASHNMHPGLLLSHLLLLTTYTMLPATTGATASPLDMCTGGSRTSSAGSLHGPTRATYPDHAQCSCNLTAANPHSSVLIFLTFSLQSQLLSCDPVLLLLPYQVCPASEGENSSLNVLVPEGEKATVILNNPHHVDHDTLVVYSAQTSLTVTCGPTLIPGLPPVAQPAYVVPQTRDVDDFAVTPAIIACIIIILVAISLVVAAVIRWRCIVLQHKQKDKGGARKHGDESRGDNPAYIHTPKASVIDVRRAGSLSSLSAVGHENGQPLRAPISGVGSLAAHSEPQYPDMVANGGYPSKANGVYNGRPYRQPPPKYPPPGYPAVGYPLPPRSVSEPALTPPHLRRSLPNTDAGPNVDKRQPEPQYSQPLQQQQRIQPERTTPQYAPPVYQQAPPCNETTVPTVAPIHTGPIHPRTSELRDTARPKTPDPAKAFNISADDLPFMDDVSDEDVLYTRGRATPPKIIPATPISSQV